MAENPSAWLRRLVRIRDAYGGDAAARKLALLRGLESRRLATARAVLRLHDTLCFLRAYPDDARVLEVVERLLGTFADRSDLRRHRRALADSGIAGTTIHFPFFWFTAVWLAERWPDRLHVEWDRFDHEAELSEMLALLTLYTETPALDELDHSTRDWIDLLKGPRETDATFLIRRFAAMRADGFAKEVCFERLDTPIRLDPGPGTPSRTHAKVATRRVHFQRSPLVRARPSLREAVNEKPSAIRSVPPRNARRLIDLAREAMVTRSRDLDVFMHADPADVRIVEFDGGLQFACMGAIPERRLLLESVYGFLTLKNGVPIGYVLNSSLFHSAAVAYNVFETYRGGESALVYGRVLAMIRHLFGADCFAVDPYQLGHENMEGLQSGAWWFYYKLGFRPHDRDVRRVLRGELSRMKHRPLHRSSLATLQRLTAEHVFYYTTRPRKDVLGHIPLGDIGLSIVRYIAKRFGSDRESAARTCSEEAARLLGLRSSGALSSGERLAWERWSPLIKALPGVARWPVSDRRALVQVVRAKGGRRESDFVLLFDRHRRLRKAVLDLATLEKG
jgi:hypothetical protein